MDKKTQEKILEFVWKEGYPAVRMDKLRDFLNTLSENDCNNLPKVASNENEITNQKINEYIKEKLAPTAKLINIRDIRKWLDSK